MGAPFTIDLRASGATQTASAVNQLRGALNQTASSTSRLGSIFSRYLGPTAVGFALLAKTRSLIAFASRIQDTSERVNVGTEALQEFDYAASLTGASLDDVGNALKHLQVSMLGALGGNKPDLKSFARLGISLDELRQKSPERIFREIADRVSKTNPSVQQLADIVNLLGRSADRLVPAFRGGFGRAAADAQRLGIVIEDSVIKKVDALGDHFGQLGRQLQSGLAGPLTWLMDRFTDLRAGVAFVSSFVGAETAKQGALRRYAGGLLSPFGPGIGTAMAAARAQLEKFSALEIANKAMEDVFAEQLLVGSRRGVVGGDTDRAVSPAARKLSSQSATSATTADALTRIGLFRGGDTATKLNKQIALLERVDRSIQSLRRDLTEV